MERVETVGSFPKKVRIELPYDPAILFLGIYPKRMRTLFQNYTCSLVFTAALFTIAETWKQPKFPSAHTHTDRHTT